METSIAAHSRSEMRRMRADSGSQTTFAERMPHRVATNAPAIECPSSAGLERFSSTCTSEMTVPMMPMVGA